MDVTHPEHAFPPQGPARPRRALASVSAQPDHLDRSGKTAFQTAVQTFINQPAATADDPANPIPNDPVIAPPIYGRWHAAVQAWTGPPPDGSYALNLDPRNRVAAGMGTQVVQSQSDAAHGLGVAAGGRHP